MSSPIYLLVGSASAGKSTTARALAASFERGVHIAVDDLRHMVVAGIAQPAPHWGPELARQVSLARATAIQVAQRYARAGFAVVIDDFFDPLGLREYRAFVANGGARGIVLQPTEAEARRRSAARHGGRPAPADEMAITHAYGFMGPVIEELTAGGWLVLDTTALDVDATVAAIRATDGQAGRHG